MSRYYAIQDRAFGYIQYVTAAEDERAALAAFDSDVGIDPHGEGLDALATQYVITELSAEQYAHLRDCSGTSQSAIDYLDEIRDVRVRRNDDE